MDDYKATQVLGAYYWENGNPEITDEMRKEWAVSKWIKQHPNDDAESAWKAVQGLIRAEAPEHQLLCIYTQWLLSQSRIMIDAIKFINEKSVDTQTARANAYFLWQVINTLLNGAAAMSRVFDAVPTKDANELRLRRYRSTLLRTALGVEGTFLEAPRLARNIMEHFEEHLDQAAHRALKQNLSMLDVAVLTEVEAAQQTGLLLRWYDPEKRLIHVLQEIISVKALETVAIEIAMLVPGMVFSRFRYHVGLATSLRGI